MGTACGPSFTAKWPVPPAGTREWTMVPALKPTRILPFSVGNSCTSPAMKVYSSASPASGQAVAGLARPSCNKSFTSDPAPRRRVTVQVNNRKDYDTVLLYPVENTVREFVGNDSPYLAVDRLILQGVLDKSVQGRFDLCNKLSTQAGTLSFVPPRSLPQVTLRLPSDEGVVFHRSLRVLFRTFSQGSTSSGFSLCCCSRSSSSRR